MTIPQREPLSTANGSDTTGQDVSSPDLSSAAGTRRSRAMTGIRMGVSTARRGVVGLAARLPATARATRAAARRTVGALQTLPDPTLRSLAATSVGLGVGVVAGNDFVKPDTANLMLKYWMSDALAIVPRLAFGITKARPCIRAQALAARIQSAPARGLAPSATRASTRVA